jgi:hypothetical protein
MTEQRKHAILFAANPALRPLVGVESPPCREATPSS